MPAENHSQIADFIWSICNLLRGPYKRNEYRKVILPLTVLRRFDCILAPTKVASLKEHAARLFPAIKVTLKTSDALCIADFGRRAEALKGGVAA